MSRLYCKYLEVFIIGALILFLPYSCMNKKKNIGIQLYTVRDEMKADPANTIGELGKIGYTFVEAAGYAEGKFYDMSPLDFKNLVEKNGMKFISSHTGMPVPDSSQWNATMTWWDSCIAAHAEAGVKYIIQPFMDSIGYQSLAGLQRYCDYFNAVGEKCKEKGIIFGYHNHNKEFSPVDGRIIYDYLLQHTDSSKVCFEMDLYWIKEGGGIAINYFNKYPGRFKLWHVKDIKEVGASGTMDFKTLFENAALAGMKYPIVEQEEYTTTHMEGARKSFEFLNNADYVK